LRGGPVHGVRRRRRRPRGVGQPARLPAAVPHPATAGHRRRPPHRALRLPAAPAVGHGRGAHGGRGGRRQPGPRRPRGPVPAGRVQHPRALRVSRATRLAPPAVLPEDLDGLHRVLLGWYSASARDLPWRRPGVGPWGVLVSEVMLQQTPVARVEPVWRSWMERWPTPAGLAAEPPGEAVRAWGRLGYPRRALRLHAA